MSNDPPEPGRWPRGSKAEDDEVHRQQELAGLEQWMAWQKLRPLTDALEHGLIHEPGECWAGPVILPDWWDEIPEPGQTCPWCQRPDVPAPCSECRTARAADVDPPAAWVWWPSLTAEARRLHIAASYGVDPWSGRHCAIHREWTDTDPDGQISTTRPLYFGAAPAGIYWGARQDR